MGLPLLKAAAARVEDRGMANAHPHASHAKSSGRSGSRQVAPGLEHLQTCIDCCLSSQRECLAALSGLRSQGGQALDPARIRALLDCSDFCQVTATFMMRGSHRHTDLAAACAKICRDCADLCVPTTDDQLLRCSEACRECETACRELINSNAERPGIAA